jgi:hypothetical protein
MSRTEIKAWAKLMGVSQAWVRKELRREDDLGRARSDPEHWVVLKYPDTTLHAFPKQMFGVPA